ncbi:hypothetical protein HKX48_001192, partial [Thoreauomyces humboldtii]
MARAVRLFGIIAEPTATGAYNVFDLELEDPDTPLSQVKTQIAAHLGLDPVDQRLNVYRIDEDITNDDPRLRKGASLVDPMAVFQLTPLPDISQSVSRWIPEIGSKNAPHVLVQPVQRETRMSLDDMPLAYGYENMRGATSSSRANVPLTPSSVGTHIQSSSLDPRILPPANLALNLRTSIMKPGGVAASASSAADSGSHAPDDRWDSNYSSFMEHLSATPGSLSYKAASGATGSPAIAKSDAHTVEINKAIDSPNPLVSTARRPYRLIIAISVVLALGVIGAIVGYVVHKNAQTSSQSDLAVTSLTSSASPISTSTSKTVATKTGVPAATATTATTVTPSNLNYVGARAIYTVPGCQGQPSSWRLISGRNGSCYSDGSTTGCVANSGGSVRSTCTPGNTFANAVIYGFGAIVRNYADTTVNCGGLEAIAMPIPASLGCTAYMDQGGDTSSWEYNSETQGLSVFGLEAQCTGTPWVVNSTCQ